MRRRRLNSTRKGEEGIVVLLVAMFLLFVVGFIAALAVDLVTFYTARSEAQQGADAAALAGARVLANSGMTSADPTNLLLESSARDLATTVATQVAVQNKVGGAVPTVAVSFNVGSVDFHNNPHVTVQVSRTDLPVFFSRILGNTAGAVSATATAEAYNPSGLNAAPGAMPSVALTCVKPWLLPNLDPSKAASSPIFDVNTGAINPAAFGLLGWNSSKSPPPSSGDFKSVCFDGDCGGGGPLPGAAAWQYYPGDQTSFPAPTQSLPSCPNIVAPLTDYQKSIAGCVATPITCQNASSLNMVNIDTITFPARAKDTADAVNCLTHATANLGDGDVADPGSSPNPAPLTYIGGNQNPIPGALGEQVMVSDSLVTVPVIDETNIIGNTAKVIGFVQLFLNADGAPAPNTAQGPIQTKIVNMIGCGNNATAAPIQGNGTSPVTVRLIAPQ